MMVYAYKLSEETELPELYITTTHCISHERNACDFREMPKLIRRRNSWRILAKGHFEKIQVNMYNTCKCTRYAHSNL